jgi:hypothetical protein
MPHHTPTDPRPETLARYEAVWEWLEHSPWDSKALKHFAADWGVCNQTVRAIRRDALAYRRAHTTDEEEYGTFLASLDRATVKTEKAAEWGPHSSMLRLQMQARGFETAPKPAEVPDAAETVQAIADALAADAGLRAELAAALGERGWAMSLNEQ